MISSVIFPFLVILVMVAFNALFVAAEFATVGARKATIRSLEAKGGRNAGTLLDILENGKKMDNYVATCQVGITLSSLVAGAYGQSQLTPLLEPIFGGAGPWVSVVIILISITALQVVLGELLPKTVALRYPEKLALKVLPSMLAAQWIFKPLVKLFNGSAFALMKKFRLTFASEHSHVHSAEELAGLYKASAAGGLIATSERDMIAGVLDVDNRIVREIMTPRRKLITISESTETAEALTTLAGSAHSRFPVVDEGGDIIGVVHIRDIFVSVTTSDSSSTVFDLMRPAIEVAEFLSVPALWRKLRESNQHCAFIVNEYGSVTGMVTMEDAIEEIFGEVRDEFDTEEEPFIVNGNKVTARGNVLLSELNEHFEMSFQQKGVDTVNGFIWHLKGTFPKVKDVVTDPASGTEFTVEAMEGKTVAKASFFLTPSKESEEVT